MQKRPLPKQTKIAFFITTPSVLVEASTSFSLHADRRGHGSGAGQANWSKRPLRPHMRKRPLPKQTKIAFFITAPSVLVEASTSFSLLADRHGHRSGAGQANWSKRPLRPHMRKHPLPKQTKITFIITTPHVGRSLLADSTGTGAALNWSKRPLRPHMRKRPLPKQTKITFIITTPHVGRSLL